MDFIIFFILEMDFIIFYPINGFIIFYPRNGFYNFLFKFIYNILEMDL